MKLDNHRDFEIFLRESDKKADGRTATRIQWLLIIVAIMAFCYLLFIDKRSIGFTFLFSLFIVGVAFVSKYFGLITSELKYRQIYLSAIASVFYGVILYAQPKLVGIIGWGVIFMFLTLSILYINRLNTITFGLLGIIGTLYLSSLYPSHNLYVENYTYLIRISLITISTAITLLSIIEVKKTVLERENKIDEIKELNNDLTNSRINIIKKNKDIEEATNRAALIAFYNEYTDLPNYAKLLDDNISLKPTVTVLSFDINRFQLIREFHDESICIGYLKDITEEIDHYLHHIDGDLYQIHYDEFVYVIQEQVSESEIEQLIESMQEVFKLNKFKDIQNYHLGLRIGVASCSSYCQDMGSLIKRATITKNSLLGDNINSHAFFTEAIEVSYQREISIKQLLNKSKDEMHIVLQPIVDIKNRQIKGFEALLRWVNETYGFISPGECIPYAEENMSIIPIGYWVLEEACKAIKSINETCNKTYSVSVNVSSLQLLSDRFVERFYDVVKRVGADPQWIIVELTENVLIESFVEISMIMKALKEKGIGIALDDFGTGYSSMAYLHQLPIDILKIDRSFVLDMEATRDTKMIEVVIKMAHQLDELVVVEGVEYEEQYHRLRVNNCDYIQGYYFSKPIDVRAFDSFVDQIQALEATIQDMD